MNLNYSVLQDPATPKYVLAVLRDLHRREGATTPEADHNRVLCFQSTVAEWRDAHHLASWLRIAEAQNQLWEINASDAEWYAVLEPAKQRYLSDVCEFIASRATRPRIRPARLFGMTCPRAGAFLTIRSLLHQAGADAWQITPSTPLAAYARQYYRLFLGPLSRLAPGALPAVQIWDPVREAFVYGAGVGLLLLIIGAFTKLAILLMLTGGLLSAVCCAGTWIAAYRLLPLRVELGDFKTFRDLAVAVTDVATANENQQTET